LATFPALAQTTKTKNPYKKKQKKKKMGEVCRRWSRESSPTLGPPPNIETLKKKEKKGGGWGGKREKRTGQQDIKVKVEYRKGGLEKEGKKRGPA